MTSDPRSGEKVRFTDVTKIFVDPKSHVTVQALQGINIGIAAGEFLCIVGPSGCGKTTLLRILGGLEQLTSGAVYVRSQSEAPNIGMVFQEESVFPWMTVESNVGYGLETRGLSRQQRAGIVQKYLEITGLSGFANAYPYQLSGGMKQRVSLARAFAADPELLLMDEPFANLDEQTRVLMQTELLSIWESRRTTIVFITHSIDESIFLGDRVVVLGSRPGRVRAEIPVPFPRPREAYAIRSQPAYGQIANQIWEIIRGEVLKDQEGQRG